MENRMHYCNICDFSAKSEDKLMKHLQKKHVSLWERAEMIIEEFNPGKEVTINEEEDDELDSYSMSVDYEENVSDPEEGDADVELAAEFMEEEEMEKYIADTETFEVETDE